MPESFTVWIEALADRPLLILAILSVPFALAAWRWRVFPHVSLALLAMLPGGLSLLVGIVPESWPVIAFLDVLLGLAAVVDLSSVVGRTGFSIHRQMQRVASLRQRHDVTLTLVHRGRRSWKLRVRDGLPDQLVATPNEFSVTVQPQSRVILHYQFRAARRGTFRWSKLHLQICSRWGLWRRYVVLSEPAEVFVYPDVRQLAEYELLARTNRLSLMGVRRTRKVGQEHDFERLRDYTRDDNYKNIDWRSTARRQRLTVKEFQTSQSQRLIFLIDCGRMMTNQVGTLTLLDHSLNAMLMLSYIAIRRGDAVGLLSFSNHVHSFVPPRSGARQMNQLLHASFDRFPQLVESRYDEAFLHLAARCRKRSLVVLITNVVDEVNARQVEQYLTAQVGRHLPMAVLLRDRHLFAPVLQPKIPDNSPQLYSAAAAAEIIQWRHQLLVDMTHRGILSLDVFPDELTAPLINRYLEIKARNLL